MISVGPICTFLAHFSLELFFFSFLSIVEKSDFRVRNRTSAIKIVSEPILMSYNIWDFPHYWFCWTNIVVNILTFLNLFISYIYVYVRQWSFRAQREALSLAFLLIFFLFFHQIRGNTVRSTPKRHAVALMKKKQKASTFQSPSKGTGSRGFPVTRFLKKPWS